MVASLLKLRLLGLVNRVRLPRSRAEQIAVAVAGVLTLAALVGIVVLGQFAAATTTELRGAAFVAVGGLTIAAFWLVPFVLRTSAGIEPAAFADFPIPPRRLAAALAIAALGSIPVLLLLALIASTIVAWSVEGVAPALAAAGAGVLALALAILGSLVANAIASDAPNARNTTGVIALAALAGLAPLLAAIDWDALGLTMLRRLAAALAWTPFGVAWALPLDVATGSTAAAWLHVAIGAAVVLLLAVIWFALVRRGARPRPALAPQRADLRLGAFDAMPATQTGVIGARSITYWLRDPRFVVPLLILPIIPAGLVLAFWLAGIPWSIIVWLPVPIMSLLIGWSVHNDVAADGTAFWLHVVTSVRGRADRWGRVLVPLTVGLIVAVVGSAISSVLADDSALVVPLTALSACALLSGLGVGSVASALLPYPTVHAGDTPFQQPQGTGGGAALAQLVSLLVAAAACLPVVGAILAVNGQQAPDYTTTAVIAASIGLAVLVIGTELGALTMRRRAPELLAFTQQN